MEVKSEEPKYPTLEQFESMSVNDKVQLFTGLPVNAQKLLVGTSAFASTVTPEMAQAVSQLKPKDFEEAKILLLDTPFFGLTETGRLQVPYQMKDFINGDLKRIWEEKQKGKSK